MFEGRAGWQSFGGLLKGMKKVTNCILSSHKEDPILNGIVFPTKIKFRSFVMSVFDSLGLNSMFLVNGNIVLQDIWRFGTGSKNRFESI